MKILLIQPGVKQAFGFKSPLLSLMPLACTLKEAGYEVELFDARRHDYKTLDLNDVLCVGITVITGSQITHALAISKYIREKNPKLRIIWGGIHPSLLPMQTAENPYVDIVVKREGEVTLLELVDALEKGKSLKKIKGIVYKENGTIINNPERPFMDLNKSVMPSFEFLKDKETYELNIIHIQTSRGCPYNCGFCYNRNFNKFSYRYKSVERVIQEIEWIIKTTGVRRIHFNDDNFFVFQDRVKKICEEMIKRKLNITWSTTCRLDYFAKYDRDFLKLVKDSGCTALTFGGESGSQRMLNYIQKSLTVEQTINAVKNAHDSRILAVLSFVCGFPTETKEDVNMTLDLIAKLKKISKKYFSSNGIFVFTPYPGTPLFDEAVKHGFKAPTSLEEWGRCYFGDTAQTPWLTPSYRRYIRNVSSIGNLLFSLPNPNFQWSAEYFAKYIARWYLNMAANIRFKLRFFSFLFIIKLYNKYAIKYN